MEGQSDPAGEVALGGHQYSDHDILIIIRNLLEQNEWSSGLCGSIAELLGNNGIEVLPDRGREVVDPETGEVTEEL